MTTAADLIDIACADGVIISLAKSGARLKLSGDPEAIDRWLVTIGQYQEALIAELAQSTADGQIKPLANDHVCISPTHENAPAALKSLHGDRSR